MPAERGPSAIAPPASRGRRGLHYALFAAILIAVVVVPFLFFGTQFEALSVSLLEAARSKPVIAGAGVALLAADVVLPIPSTVVVAALGALLGAVPGTIVAVAGLTLGCAIGFGLGRLLGHDFALRQLGGSDFGYLSGLFERHGLPILALCRPVPVLAEASIIAAGVLGLPAGKALMVTGLANIGFAGVYATLGAAAESPLGFAIAFAASLAIPAGAIFAANRVRR
jgi:uncharacterized membrane protein YdjX (TVP38/TMEM64 family)